MRFAKTIVIALAACSIALPAAASADSLPPTFKSDAASSSDAQGYSIQPQTGGRVPVANDDVIEVVRPERTIVRDVDQALPLILSGTALLLVLAGVGFTLVRIRMAPRPGRSH